MSDALTRQCFSAETLESLHTLFDKAPELNPFGTMCCNFWVGMAIDACSFPGVSMDDRVDLLS